uniref:CRAL-TRIO domain-containing protein n=1 Tax=Syphacia muris TaxID=451379 RepID=A0A158R5B9_9BILA
MTILNEKTNDCPTSNHDDLLLQLRNRLQHLLQQYPEYNSDYALLRWLQGRNYDLGISNQDSFLDQANNALYDSDEVEAALNWALRSMDMFGIFQKDFTTFQSIRDVVKETSPLMEYIPGGPLGLDKHGNIIVLNLAGKMRPKQLLKYGRVSEFIIAAVCECEGVQHILRIEEQKRGKKLGVVLINDLQDLSFEILSSVAALKIYFSILQTIQKFFADSSIKIYLINVPFALYAIWSMMEKVIAKETVGKIEILDKNFKTVLVKNHGANCLPEIYGGTMKFTWSEDCGSVSASIRERIEREMSNKRNSMEKNLQRLTVAAGEEKVVSVTIEKSGSRLFWYFKCSNDIEFCVKYENAEVWPKLRLSTEFVPEYNEITCTEAGCYSFVFDNSDGLVWSKKVYYSYQIIPPAIN